MLLPENAKRKIFHATLATPLGHISLVAEKEQLLSIKWLYSSDNSLKLEADEQGATSKVLEQAKSQLDQYFLGQRKIFDLSLSPAGTSFQQRVWHQIGKIPYGETASYKEIAEIIANKKMARAVGQAAKSNPLIIVIPCHRLVGHSGDLTGYSGGRPAKKYLLKLEAAFDNSV